ncbi:RICIN domain-containing protein [Streptomyces inhibens]|uniref:RICIN domain-containing protein n=1 Tax=Streptomyces inhibens TaxID=2293571 RepID=UPI001EE70371|nr:RICIN domain-containing protein [Streptomyces inhibens]UKY47844.1 RICIN domain-containing protein [Streptomyces inhibens]
MLDVGRGWAGDGMSNIGSLSVYPHQGSDNEKFQFRDTGDGSFQMVVRDTGKCIFQDGSQPGGGWNREVDCQVEDNQKFYLEPTSNGYFMIRSVSDSNCMNALGGYSGQNFVYHTNHVGSYSCNQGDSASLWKIEDPADSSGQALRSLAAEYGMTRCDKDQSLCKFNKTDVTNEEKGASRCHNLIDNTAGSTEAPLKYTKAESSINSQTTGTAIRKGVEVGIELGVSGGPFSAKVSSKFTESWESNYARTNGTTHTASQDVTAMIPAGEYGWVEEVPRKVTVTGDFVFNPNAWNEWHYAGGTKVTAATGAGNNGVFSAEWILRHSATKPTTGSCV